MENPIKIRWFGGKPPDFRKHPYRKKKPLRFSGANTTCAPVSFTREEWQAPCSEGGFLAEGSNPKNAILWGSWLKIYLGNPQWCQLFVASDPRAVDDFFVEKVKVLVKIFFGYICGTGENMYLGKLYVPWQLMFKRKTPIKDSIMFDVLC